MLNTNPIGNDSNYKNDRFYSFKGNKYRNEFSNIPFYFVNPILHEYRTFQTDIFSLNDVDDFRNIELPDLLVGEEADEIRINLINEENVINRNENSSKIVKKRGRKKKESNEVGAHNKYTEDNITKRLKNNICDWILQFLNSEIKKSFNNEKMLLKKINPKQSKINKADENKSFIYKTLKDIYSNNISNKYKNFELEYNKKIIDKLITQNNLEIKAKFTNLFNLKFIQCIDHLIGNTKIKELEGMETLSQFVEKYFDGEESQYKEKLKETIINYEKIINGKISRKRKSNNLSR